MRILIVFLWILTGLTTGVVASDKGHGFGSWTFAGLLLGPIGLIAAAGLSDQKLREYIRRTIDSRLVEPIQSTKKLLNPNDLYFDSTPKLLKESSYDFEDQKQKNIGDFLLDKDAKDNQIWLKIIEMFEFGNPDLVYLADQSKSNTILSVSGGKAYIIRDSVGEKVALAYTKSIADDKKFHWQIKVY